MHTQHNTDMSSDFEAFWRPFTRTFQAFCISHYSVFRPHLRNNRLKSLPFQIYFIGFAAAHLVLAILNNEKGHRSDSKSSITKFKDSPLMYYVNALDVIVSVATHIIIHLEYVL